MAAEEHIINKVDVTTRGMWITLVLNVIMFIFLLCFFEGNRFYRQIFLKRLQKRFIDIGKYNFDILSYYYTDDNTDYQFFYSSETNIILLSNVLP